MASKASREARKARALELVQRVFSAKTSGKSNKTSLAAALEAARGQPITADLPGLEALIDGSDPDEVVGPSKRVYHSTSLGCLRPSYWPRRPVIFFVEWPIFDAFILLTIMTNCVTMAWESPLDPTGTWKSELIDVSAAVTYADCSCSTPSCRRGGTACYCCRCYLSPLLLLPPPLPPLPPLLAGLGDAAALLPHFCRLLRKFIPWCVSSNVSPGAPAFTGV